MKTLVRVGISVLLVVLVAPVNGHAQDVDQITAKDVAGISLKFTHVKVRKGKTGVTQASPLGIPGIDSVPNFSGAFSTPGFGPSGKPQSTWFFNTLGNPAEKRGPTKLAKILYVYREQEGVGVASSQGPLGGTIPCAAFRRG